MPLISFIIPTYNTAPKLLQRCIRSVLFLPLEDEEKEVIVVDDGSYTPVEDTLDEQTKDAIIILHQSNKGPGAARNLGMDHAKGDFIQFVDADDFLLLEPYSKVIDRMREGNTDMIRFLFHNRDNGNATFAHRSKHAEQGIISGTDYMLHNNLMATPCLYIFRNTNIRFPENIFHEDEIFTTLVTLNAKAIALIPAHAYYYYVSSDSTMTRHTKEWITRRLNDIHTAINMLQSQFAMLSAEVQKQALERKICQLTMDYIYNIAKLTKDRNELSERVSQLKQQGLYPLPRHSYTWKYRFFAFLTRIISM